MGIETTIKEKVNETDFDQLLDIQRTQMINENNQNITRTNYKITMQTNAIDGATYTLKKETTKPLQHEGFSYFNYHT